jgi:hypothetical protein
MKAYLSSLRGDDDKCRLCRRSCLQVVVDTGRIVTVRQLSELGKQCSLDNKSSETTACLSFGAWSFLSVLGRGVVG